MVLFKFKLFDRDHPSNGQLHQLSNRYPRANQNTEGRPFVPCPPRYPRSALSWIQTIWQAISHEPRAFIILQHDSHQLNCSDRQPYQPLNHEDSPSQPEEHPYQSPSQDLPSQSYQKSLRPSEQQVQERLQQIVKRIAKIYHLWKENQGRVVQLLNEQHILAKWQKQIDFSYNLLAQLRLSVHASMPTLSQQPNPEAKSIKKSQPDSHSQGVSSSQSSIRSLLTEKLKNLPLQPLENQFECIGEKVIVRSNWMMKEIIRRESNQTVTEPLKELSNQSENSPQKNPQSLQVEPFSLLRTISKKKAAPNRLIAKQMNLEKIPQERKAKTSEIGCSRCDIY